MNAVSLLMTARQLSDVKLSFNGGINPMNKQSAVPKVLCYTTVKILLVRKRNMLSFDDLSASATNMQPVTGSDGTNRVVSRFDHPNRVVERATMDHPSRLKTARRHVV
jgi:hypothetical protein